MITGEAPSNKDSTLLRSSPATLWTMSGGDRDNVCRYQGDVAMSGARGGCIDNVRGNLDNARWGIPYRGGIS